MLLRGALALVILLGLPGVALAGEPGETGAGGGGGSAGEIASLEAQIGKDAEALSTAGCAVACQALASMRRSVERLCELDRGPRCASAQGKLGEAEARVRGSCPECSVAGGLTPPVARADAPPVAAEPGRAEVQVARHGGCAGCEVGGEGEGGAGLVALAVGAWLASARRRRRA